MVTRTIAKHARQFARAAGGKFLEWRLSEPVEVVVKVWRDGMAVELLMTLEADQLKED
jgi:hypothetical protein